jgi:hypothetical protein
MTEPARKRRKPTEPTSNAQAVNRVLTNMYPDGPPADHLAYIQVCKALAAAVDLQPDAAALWKQYREALADLDAINAAEEDGIGELLTRLSTKTDD